MGNELNRSLINILIIQMMLYIFFAFDVDMYEWALFQSIDPLSVESFNWRTIIKVKFSLTIFGRVFYNADIDISIHINLFCSSQNNSIYKKTFLYSPVCQNSTSNSTLWICCSIYHTMASMPVDSPFSKLNFHNHFPKLFRF